MLPVSIGNYDDLCATCKHVTIRYFRENITRANAPPKSGTFYKYWLDPQYGEVHTVVTAGDVRRDGVRRYYGNTRSSFFFELTQGDDNKWDLSSPLPDGGYGGGSIVIGDARNDGRQRLYLQSSRAILELFWNGSAWEKTLIPDLDRIDGEFTIAALRPDSIKRIYAAHTTHIKEFTFSDGGWRAETISAERGYIKHFVASSTPEEPLDSAYFSILNSDFIFRLRWVAGDAIAVIPFVGDESTVAEARDISDLLEVRLKRIANCSVLERQALKQLLDEHDLHRVHPVEEVVRLGKLLHAKRIVVGTLHTLFGSRILTVNSVSVRSGKIEYSKTVHWAQAVELHSALDELALAACPAPKI